MVYDSTNESISLRWETPKSDGGHKIIGYDVERQNLPTKQWIKCNVANISNTHFKVPNLTAGESYNFRVLAKNSAGNISEPSYPTGPIVCKEEFGNLFFINGQNADYCVNDKLTLFLMCRNTIHYFECQPD